MKSLFEDSYCGATFSPCRTWRYVLWRTWDDRPRIAFVGLNPSTADETTNDPTVRRCINFARRWGFGGMVMLNAFGFRSTDPAGLLTIDDPVGPGNDREIIAQAAACRKVVVAWGVMPASLRARQDAVLDLLGEVVFCLGRTKDGWPKHPLYLSNHTELMEFKR